MFLSMENTVRRGSRLLLIDTTRKEDGERVGKSDEKSEEEMDSSSCFYIITAPPAVGMLRLSM